MSLRRTEKPLAGTPFPNREVRRDAIGELDRAIERLNGCRAREIARRLRREFRRR